MKTYELAGPALDWAVAKAEGGTALAYIVEQSNNPILWKLRHYGWSPSSRWEQAGSLIEREKLVVKPRLIGGEWLGEWLSVALGFEGQVHTTCAGPTPLIAAMRAYVGCKLGEDVDIPAELSEI